MNTQPLFLLIAVLANYPHYGTNAQSPNRVPLDALGITIQLPPNWLMERTEEGYACAPPQKTFAVAIVEDRIYTYEQAVARLPYGVDLDDGTFIVTTSDFKELFSGAIHVEAAMGNLIKQVKVGGALWKLGSGRMVFALAIPLSEDYYTDARDAMIEMLGSAREMSGNERASGRSSSQQDVAMSALLKPWYTRLRGARSNVMMPIAQS
jgi:hypothetical protein